MSRRVLKTPSGLPREKTNINFTTVKKTETQSMTILGIDTSTPIGSIALIDGDNLVAEHTLNIVQAHSSRLMPAIDSVLKWG